MFTIDFIIFVLTATVNAVLGLAVFARDPRSPVNRSFLLVTASIITYLAANYPSDHAAVYSTNLLFTHLAFVTAYWIPFALLIFSFHFPVERRWPRWALPAGLIALIAGSWFSFSSLLLAAVNKTPTGVDLVPGPLFIGWPILFLALISLCVLSVLEGYRQANQIVKNKLKYIALGTSLSSILGILINLTLTFVIGNQISARYGPLSTIVFMAAMGYALIKHRFLSIRLVMARATSYLLLGLTVVSVYALATYGLIDVLYARTLAGLGLTFAAGVAALGSGAAFVLLRRPYQEFLDHLFDVNSYDTNEALFTIGEVLAAERRVNPLLKRFLQTLIQTIGVENAALVVTVEKDQTRVAHFGAPRLELPGPAQLKILRQTLSVADELSPSSKAKAMMEKHKLGIALDLRAGRTRVGRLLLGYKVGGYLYTDQDLELLRVLASELAVAIVNAESYERIASFNDVLQAKVNEATEQLQVANKNLKSLDRAKDDFIALASRQLASPLEGLNMYIRQLEDSDVAKGNPVVVKELSLAHHSLEQIGAVVQDLLDVIRFQSGRLFYSRQPTDLGALIVEQASAYQTEAQEKGVEFNIIGMGGELPPLYIDPASTRQVIKTLLRNAVQYTAHGSVTVKLARVKDGLELTVSDTGIGVPKAAQSKLFTRFYRAPNASAAKPTGTGLGLFLGKQVIEAQGGKIVFQSTEGQGSTFGFTLPLKPHYLSLDELASGKPQAAHA